MHDKNLAHYIVVTGILVKDGKYLIVKRADWEYLDTVDYLEDVSGAIEKIKLEFISNEVPKEI